MEQIVIQGVYRRNTRGRSYLIFRDSSKIQRILPVSSKFPALNGQTITVIGTIVEGRLMADKIIPCVYPRRAKKKDCA